MLSFADYISLDDSIPSRSQLYADSLPGIDSEMIDGLAKEGKDEEETWAVLYKRACDGLVNDIRKLLNNKFLVDLKLVSRETSVFKESGNSGGGIEIEFDLPKYAGIHVLSVQVYSEQEYATPDMAIRIYKDDESGELLFETSTELSEGKNTINIDRTFYVDKIFITYDQDFLLRDTENKRYQAPYYKWTCNECIFDCGGYEGRIKHVGGGGLNVFYNVSCSVEKFVLENLNLFAQSLLWKIGIVITEERRFGERLNKYSTMQLERAEELMGYYTDKYNQEIEETIKGVNIREDPYCFACKTALSRRSSTP